MTDVDDERDDAWWYSDDADVYHADATRVAVCVEHMRFVPCRWRGNGRCDIRDNSADVTRVRNHQQGEQP